MGVNTATHKYLGLVKTQESIVEGKTQRESNIELIYNFTDEETIQYSSSYRILIGFFGDLDLFGLVERNYAHYKSLLQTVATAVEQNDKKLFFGINWAFEFNYSLINFLSSAVIYLSYTEKNLAREYGEASEEAQRFHRFQSDEYDSHFEYRFLYSLRNYTQHYGFAIDHFHRLDEINPLDPQKPFRAITVGITKHKILSSGFKWNKKMEADLKSAPDILDINAHIDGFMVCMRRILQNYNVSEFPRVKKAALQLKTLLSKIDDKQGVPCVVDVPIDENNKSRIRDKNLNLHFEEIPVQLIESIVSESLDPLVSPK